MDEIIEYESGEGAEEIETVITSNEELTLFASSDIPQIYNPARKELERRRLERLARRPIFVTIS